MSRIQDRTGVTSESDKETTYNKAVTADETVANVHMSRRFCHLTNWSGAYTPEHERQIDRLMEVNTSERDTDFEGACLPRRANINDQKMAAQNLLELRGIFHYREDQINALESEIKLYEFSDEDEEIDEFD